MAAPHPETTALPLKFMLSAVAIGIVVVGLLMPRYVRAWFRANIVDILRLLASVALMGTAITFARKLDNTYLHVAGILLAVSAELAFLLIDDTFRPWVKAISIDQWRAIDAETVRDPAHAGTFDWRVLIILVVAAVSLTLQEYVGDRGQFERWFPAKGFDTYYELKGFAWWSGWRILGYVVIPWTTVLLMPGERLRDYHVSPKGFFHHLWIYVMLFAMVFPAVIIASTTPAFRHTYPFYRMANRSHFDMWTWEALYAAQFLSLEIFFRGFLLQGLRRALGSNAIFVMIVPYCMIHYGKPLPETLGAIGAGLILGTIAMRTKSIWGGVLIHVGVAMTMDVFALRGCPPIGSNRWCGY